MRTCLAAVMSSMPVKDDIATNPSGNKLAFVLGPDETKVELIENTTVPAIVMHHIHWAAPDVAAMKAWYVQMFGARPGRTDDGRRRRRLTGG